MYATSPNRPWSPRQSGGPRPQISLFVIVLQILLPRTFLGELEPEQPSSSGTPCWLSRPSHQERVSKASSRKPPRRSRKTPPRVQRARKPATTRLNLSGHSRGGQWPQPCRTRSSESGRRSCALRAHSTGTTRSRSPWTRRVGAATSPKRSERSVFSPLHPTSLLRNERGVPVPPDGYRDDSIRNVAYVLPSRSPSR